MRLNEINEAFNTVVDKEVVKSSNNLYIAKANIGDRIITFTASYDNYSDAWEIIFSEKKDDNSLGTYSKTGSGNELQVFSFVIDCVKDLISQYQPGVVEFTADKTDENRASLYKRIAHRIKNIGYDIDTINCHGNTHFRFTRKDIADK
jgi:hypothetical protein